MKKGRIRKSLKQRMSMKTKLIIGASVATAALAAFIFIKIEEDDATPVSELIGDYRVVGNGDWTDNSVWQVMENGQWVPAAEAPGKGANSIVVSEGSELVVTEEATATKVTIEKGGKLVLAANTFSVFKSGGKGGIYCKGELDMDECIIDGNGDMKVSDDAILHIGSPEGLDKRSLAGNIQLRGAVDLSKKATYIYDGSVKQSIGNGIPVFMETFVVNNNSGVFMQSDISVNKLQLESGVVFTGPYAIRVGTSVTSGGIISRKKGMVQGAVSKWFGTDELESLVFPMGDEGGVYRFKFSTAEPAFKRGLVELKYHPGKPDAGFVSPFAAGEIKIGITEFGYFTAKFTNGPEEALLISDGSLVGADGENTSKWKLVSNSVASQKGENEPRNLENFLLGPDPFTSGFTVTFTAGEPTMAIIQLVNKSGKVVHSETIPVESGKNKYEFTAGDKVSPGNYVLRISNPMEIHTLTATRK